VKGRRFFAVVWRVNAILLLLVATLAVGLFGFAMFQMYRESRPGREAVDVLNVADERIDSSKVQLGSFQQVVTSGVLRAALETEQEHGFSSGSGAEVRNYLYYDASNGASRWLLAGNKGLILATHELPQGGCSDTSDSVAVVYELVEADTNGDSKLTGSDAKVIAVSNPAGSRLTRIVVGVQDVNGTTLTPAGRILVFYTSSATLRVAEVDAETHRIIRDAPLQPAKNDSPK